MKKKKKYNNEIFLNINEISEISKIDCARICSDMNQYFYLNGVIPCILEDTNSDKTMKVIARSIYKNLSPNINYENGEYDIQGESWAETCYLKGFFTSCSHRDHNNQPLIAFKPTEYCTLKHEDDMKEPSDSFKPFIDNEVIIPLNAVDLFKALDKCREGYADKALRMEILDEIEKMRFSNKSHNDESSLIRNFCNEKNVWYDQNHFTKCLIEQCVNSNNGLKESKDLACTTYYRLSEIRDQMEKYGIDFDISTESNEINSETKDVTCTDIHNINRLLALLSAGNTPGLKALTTTLSKFIEDTGIESIPDYKTLENFIIKNYEEITLIFDVDPKGVFLSDSEYIKFKALKKAYKYQLKKIQ